MKSISPSGKIAWFEYGLATAIFAAVSVLNLLLKRWIGYQAIALVYLLAVVLLALFVGRGPILLGTALTALGWSFLFAPPPYSFHIGSFYDKMMFAMYFIVALTVAQLTARLRAERLAEQKREERSRALYLFTRELAGAADQGDIFERVVTQVSKVFNADIILLLKGTQVSAYFAGSDRTWILDASAQELQERACQNNEPVGRGTLISPEARELFLPLSAGGAVEGVLVIRSQPGSDLTSNQRDLLENFASQTALVLERQRLREAEVQTKLLTESERFGRTLLNSVSHELRTPLAAISAAAATLRDSDQLNPLQQKLSAEIDSATARLNRVVQSLLSAARIQSGQLHPKIDWCDINDLVQVVLREAGPVLAGHPVQKRCEPGLPLIRADFTLLQQAVTNLLVNAATHTPPGVKIELRAARSGAELVLEVADEGPGLAEDELKRVFDLFHRAPGSKPGGTGLGLAIVKGFIETQGGRVMAKNRSKGGALFSIHMPIMESPPISEESP
jgi:two-component system sensor histidine kinase KdpD